MSKEELKEAAEKEERELLDELDELDSLYLDDTDDTDTDADDTDDDADTDKDTGGSEDDNESNKESDKDESETDSEKESKETSEEEEKESTEESEDSEEKETSEDARYEKLLAQIDELKGKLAEKSPEKAPEIEEVDFLAEISLDDLGSDSSLLNKVFNRVLKEAVKNSSKATPQIISKQVEESLSIHEIAEQFYKTNKDLSNVRNVVKACAKQIISEHEDWKIDQILEESAKRTRESLGIPIPDTSKASVDSDISDINNASFSGGSRGSRQAIKKDSALQQELDEM